MLTAGLLKLVVSLGAWLIARVGGLRAGHADPAAAERGGRGVHGRAADALGAWVLLATAAFTGMASFVYEVVWIRMLSMVLGASTHSFELMLSAFHRGLALGQRGHTPADRPYCRTVLGCSAASRS